MWEVVLDSILGVGMDSDFGFLNMKIRNLGAGRFSRGSRLRLGARHNWENFSSGNKLYSYFEWKLIWCSKIKIKTEKRKENLFDEKTGRLFDENTHTLLAFGLSMLWHWTMAN